MAKASKDADKVLRETKNHKEAWNTFRGFQRDAWIKAKPCQRQLKELEDK